MSYLGNKPADSYLTLEKQTFTTSATDTYTLDRAVSSVNDIELFLNNVRQEPTEAYTISGTTLTLASPITASDSMYCIYQGRAVGTQSPAVGSVTNDMLAGSIATSKLADGSTFATTNGITELDQWRLTSDALADGTISSNLERVDTHNSTYIGSGMTVSSGVWTFPSTGIWLIHFFARIQVTGGDTAFVFAETTTNNSTYSNASFVMTSSASGDGGSTSAGNFIFDVTDTSTHKVRFFITSLASGGFVGGNTSETNTGFTFMRIGDT